MRVFGSVYSALGKRENINLLYREIFKKTTCMSNTDCMSCPSGLQMSFQMGRYALDSKGYQDELPFSYVQSHICTKLQTFVPC